jgi:hypothetical protein
MWFLGRKAQGLFYQEAAKSAGRNVVSGPKCPGTLYQKAARVPLQLSGRKAMSVPECPDIHGYLWISIKRCLGRKA